MRVWPVRLAGLDPSVGRCVRTPEGRRPGREHSPDSRTHKVAMVETEQRGSEWKAVEGLS